VVPAPAAVALSRSRFYHARHAYRTAADGSSSVMLGDPTTPVGYIICEMV